MSWRRVRAVLRARLAAEAEGGSTLAAAGAALPAPALISSLLCALVRDALPPFAYGLFALSLSAALVAIRLLGELGWLLRRDTAAEWIGALPVRARELETARVLHLTLMLWILALGSLVPAAVFAPEHTPLLPRLLLPVLGLGLATFLAAVLLVVQNLLGERAEALLVAFQTLLVIGVVVGVIAGLRAVPQLARIPTLGDEHAPFLWLFPPSWFAAPIASVEGQPPRWWLPASASLASFALLLSLPTPAATRHPRSRWLSVLLWPVRAFVARSWVRRDERGPFDLVYDALPLEREVVLRTVPMIGLPLAFLVLSAGSDPPAGAPPPDILAILLFTVGIYLPILLTHVPACRTPEAAWLHRSAPVPAGAVVAGTIKALTVRFLVPLYAALAVVTWDQAGADAVLRLAVPGFLISLAVLRRLYPICVGAPPLSTAPEELRFDLDWFALLGGLALILPVAAGLANRLLTPFGAILLVAGLLAVERASDRALRRRLG